MQSDSEYGVTQEEINDFIHEVMFVVVRTVEQ